MKQQSIFDALVKLSKKNAPEEAQEDERPRLKRRDQRSARAKARNAAHRRAIARGIPKQSKFAPKRRWTTPGFRTGWRPPPGASVLDRIVRAMEPGCWYAVSDLMNLARLTRNEFLGVRLFNHGYSDQAQKSQNGRGGKRRRRNVNRIGCMRLPRWDESASASLARDDAEGGVVGEQKPEFAIMLFLVVSTPRPERPSELAETRHLSGLGSRGTKHEAYVGTFMLA